MCLQASYYRHSISYLFNLMVLKPGFCNIFSFVLLTPFALFIKLYIYFVFVCLILLLSSRKLLSFVAPDSACAEVETFIPGDLSC